MVYLQNKVIGKNHVQWDPNYRYKAWYKAYDHIVFGDSVTPKTDPGPYIIEETGEITAYACNGVSLKPGFHAKAGSRFHAYVQCDGCSRPHEKSGMAPSGGNSSANGEHEERSGWIETDTHEPEKENELQVFPNPASGEVTIVFPAAQGEYVISDANGRIYMQQPVGEENKISYLGLPKGVYILKWRGGKSVQTKKIIVL
jgi:hypothetical protein